MKALEKERGRRYPTANDLARDIEHYLHDEPVEARPPSAVYRFQKFARRNRVALITTTVVATALVAGTIASTWQAVRARQAETIAEAERNEADVQRLRARPNVIKRNLSGGVRRRTSKRHARRSTTMSCRSATANS